MRVNRIPSSLTNTAPAIVSGALTSFLLLELALRESPPGFPATAVMIVGGIVAGMLAQALRLTRYLTAVSLVLLGAWLVLSFTPLIGVVTRTWPRVDPVRDSLDAVVVLSSSVLTNDALDSHGVDRLLGGLELAKRTGAPRLITTRIFTNYHHHLFYSDSGQARLIRLAGLEARWTEVGPLAYTTHEEATLVARALLPTQRRIAVVTSPMHTRRACATFEAVGFTVTCVASVEHDLNRVTPQTAHERLPAFRSYMYEQLAILKYRRAGWTHASP